MLEVKVKKEDLQAKIQEEITKIKFKFGDNPCKNINNLKYYIESKKASKDFMGRHPINHNIEEYWQICNEVSEAEDLLSATVRLNKLNTMLKMLNVNTTSEVPITEVDYKFIYEAKHIKKIKRKTYKEIIEEFRGRSQDGRTTTKEKQPTPPPPPQGYDYDKVEPLPTRVVQDRYQPNKQEVLWLSWLIVVIIAGVILLFVFK